MTRPERYQLPFDFARRDEPSPVTYAIGWRGEEGQLDDSGRLVRAVREEVIVRSPFDAAQHLLTHIYQPFEAFDQEELWVLLLNTRHRLTHEALVYRGTVNSIQLRPAELFKAAVRVNAPALLLSHVHPSGDPSPSLQDVQVTQEAVAAGKLLGIEVLDHLIVGREAWRSLKEQGLGFG
jgi:DNA repair protein RadC